MSDISTAAAAAAVDEDDVDADAGAGVDYAGDDNVVVVEMQRQLECFSADAKRPRAVVAAAAESSLWSIVFACLCLKRFVFCLFLMRTLITRRMRPICEWFAYCVVVVVVVVVFGVFVFFFPTNEL